MLSPITCIVAFVEYHSMQEQHNSDLFWILITLSKLMGSTVGSGATRLSEKWPVHNVCL